LADFAFDFWELAVGAFFDGYNFCFFGRVGFFSILFVPYFNPRVVRVSYSDT
jgi:hypothetical protein